jgi:hypothetical protein
MADCRQPIRARPIAMLVPAAETTDARQEVFCCTSSSSATWRICLTHICPASRSRSGYDRLGTVAGVGSSRSRAPKPSWTAAVQAAWRSASSADCSCDAAVTPRCRPRSRIALLQIYRRNPIPLWPWRFSMIARSCRPRRATADTTRTITEPFSEMFAKSLIYWWAHKDSNLGPAD